MHCLILGAFFEISQISWEEKKKKPNQDQVSWIRDPSWVLKPGHLESLWLAGENKWAGEQLSNSLGWTCWVPAFWMMDGAFFGVLSCLCLSTLGDFWPEPGALLPWFLKTGQNWANQGPALGALAPGWSSRMQWGEGRGGLGSWGVAGPQKKEGVSWGHQLKVRNKESRENLTGGLGEPVFVRSWRLDHGKASRGHLAWQTPLPAQDHWALP